MYSSRTYESDRERSEEESQKSNDIIEEENHELPQWRQFLSAEYQASPHYIPIFQNAEIYESPLWRLPSSYPGSRSPSSPSSEDVISPCSPHRRKRHKRITRDLISSLPDSLLHHILTFLYVDEAVRTSVLSKRWHFLWTCMPDFNFHQYSDEETYDFVTQVDRTLLLCNPVGKLNKLAVEFDYYTDGCAAAVDTWIRFATQRKVGNLELNLASELRNQNYWLPQHLYKNTSLRNLSLSCVTLLPGGIVSWTSLKSLTLEHPCATGEGISKIMSGSPVLEFLKIQGFTLADHLHICSTSLKELVIWDSLQTSDNIRLEISAPNLQSLEVWPSVYQKLLHLLDVSSLVSAYIEYTSTSNAYFEDLKKLLLSLSHVEVLHLGSGCIEVFSRLKSEGLIYFPSIKILTLDLYNEASILPCLSRLLPKTAKLETLSIKKADCGYTGLQYPADEERWKSLERRLSSLLVPLKRVKITGFCLFHGDPMLELVKFLLKNARVLEEMILSGFAADQYYGCSSSRSLEVAKELLSFPRSSPKSTIIFS